jgi:hypothetical protein
MEAGACSVAPFLGWRIQGEELGVCTILAAEPWPPQTGAPPLIAVRCSCGKQHGGLLLKDLGTVLQPGAAVQAGDSVCHKCLDRMKVAVKKEKHGMDNNCTTPTVQVTVKQEGGSSKDPGGGSCLTHVQLGSRMISDKAVREHKGSVRTNWGGVRRSCD